MCVFQEVDRGAEGCSLSAGTGRSEWLGTNEYGQFLFLFASERKARVRTCRGPVVLKGSILIIMCYGLVQSYWLVGCGFKGLWLFWLSRDRVLCGGGRKE